MSACLESSSFVEAVEPAVPCGKVGFELGKDSVARGWGSESFADLAEADGTELRPAMLRANEFIGGGGAGKYLGGMVLAHRL
jgi:hypothetical protein